jgi:hypothetical protein
MPLLLELLGALKKSESLEFIFFVYFVEGN